MPNPIDGYVEQVRRSRRTAARAVERMRSGELGPEEVDFCDLLFGQVKVEAKLAGLGLLDDGGLCDEMVAAMAHRLRLLFDQLAPFEELADRLKSVFPQVKEEFGREPPVKVDPVRDEARNDRNNERVVARAASLLAMHLCQRAMYEALGSVLRDMVADQSDWTANQKLLVGLVHSPLRLSAENVASADGAIERLRRPHLAKRRRPPASASAVAAGFVAVPEVAPDAAE